MLEKLLELALLTMIIELMEGKRINRKLLLKRLEYIRKLKDIILERR